jgi:HYR domain
MCDEYALVGFCLYQFRDSSAAFTYCLFPTPNHMTTTTMTTMFSKVPSPYSPPSSISFYRRSSWSMWRVVVVLLLWSTFYLSGTNAQIRCSRCTTSGTRKTFPVWSCDALSGVEGNSCQCPREDKEAAIGNGPEGTCEIRSGQCSCETTDSDWGPTCPTNYFSDGIVCDNSVIYMCWNVVPPQVLGLLITNDGERCPVDSRLDDVFFCDNDFLVNPVVGDGNCGNICQTDTCPNGGTITQRLYLTSPSAPDDPTDINWSPAYGCIYNRFGDSMVVDGWILDIVEQIPGSTPLDIADYNYVCPPSLPVQVDADCYGEITYTEPSCQNSYISENPPGSEVYAGFGEITLFTGYYGGTRQECRAQLDIQDSISPTISSCPENILVTAVANQCSAPVTYTLPTFTDNCPLGSPTLIQGLASGSNFPLGLTQVQYNVVDSAGNTATCSFDVQVNGDVPLPVLTCPTSISVMAASGQCDAVVNYAVTSAHACNGGSVTLTRTQGSASGSTFPQGMTIVAFESIGANPSTSTVSCNVPVTVTVQSPTISTCPTSISVGYCGRDVTFGAVTAVGCGVSVSQSRGFSSGSSFPVGTTINTFDVTDIVGNSATCIFSITVANPLPPTITFCPAPRTVRACEAFVLYETPTAVSECGTSLTPLLVAGLESGSEFPIGTTSVMYTATDSSSGTEATCTFDITVAPAVAPTITCPAPISVTYCQAAVNYVTPMGTNECGETLIPTIGGLVSGSTFPFGTTTSVTFTATDSSTNTAASCTLAVTVANPVAPTITCPADIAVTVCNQRVTYTAPSSTSECEVSLTPTLQSGIPSGALFPVGTTINSFRVIDPNFSDLSGTCSFQVTVVDDRPPRVTCSISTVCGKGSQGGCAFQVAYSTADDCNGVISGPVTVSSAHVQSICLPRNIPVTSSTQTINWNTAGYKCPKQGKGSALRVPETATLVVQVRDASGNTARCEAVTNSGKKGKRK